MLFLLLTGCSKDDSPGEPKGPENPVEEKSQVRDHLFLVNDAENNRVFLMNEEKNNVFEWQLQSGIGNDCFLMDNGQLLALLQAENPFIEFGGYGGKLQIINPDFSVAWEYKLSNENEIAHHDIEMLPNGNILAIVWEKKGSEAAKAVGFKEDYDIYPEMIASTLIQNYSKS